MAKKILKALAAGLGSVAQSVQRKEAEDKEDALRKEQYAREDRDFDLRKRSADIAAEKARMENIMTQTQINSRKIADAFNISKGAIQPTVDAVNQYGNVGHKYRYNPSMSKDGVEMFDVGQYVSDGKGGFEKNEDGTMKFEPKLDNDGQPVTEPFDKAGAASLAATVTKPFVALAATLQAEQFKTELKNAEAMGGVKAKVAGQVAKATGDDKLTAAKTKEAVANANYKDRLPQDNASDLAKGGTVRNVAGDDIKLTTNDIQALRDFAKQIFGEEGDAIDISEAHRLKEIKENKDYQKDLKDYASVVVRDIEKKGEVINGIMEDYSLSRAHAERILDGIVDYSDGWFSSPKYTFK